MKKIFIIFLSVIFLTGCEIEELEPVTKNIGDELICKNYSIKIENFDYKTGEISDFQKIPDGEEWIGIIATVTNTSDKKITFHYSDINIINSNGEIIKPDTLTYKVWNADALGSPELAAGGFKTGYVAFSNSSVDNSNITLEIKCDRNGWTPSSEQYIYHINISK